MSDQSALHLFEVAMTSIDKLLLQMCKDQEALVSAVHAKLSGEKLKRGQDYKSIRSRLSHTATRFSDKIDEVSDLIDDLFDKPTESEIEFVCDDDQASESDPDYSEGSAEFTEEEVPEDIDEEERESIDDEADYE